MIEVKLSFESYEEAANALAKLAGGAVVQTEAPVQTVEAPKPKPAPKKAAKKVEPKPEPVVEEQPEPVQEEMPAPPVLEEQPEEVVEATNVPFDDSKSMIAYVMGAYKELGPQKGSGIQEVLTALKYQNINDIDPKDYQALYNGIEALKG
jgi:outer membrane biosynthesis protein TonB